MTNKSIVPDQYSQLLKNLIENRSLMGYSFDFGDKYNKFVTVNLNDNSIEDMKNLDWQIRRIYCAYDFENHRIRIFLPELITNQKYYHYIELPMFLSKSPITEKSKINTIIKSAKSRPKNLKTI